MLKSCFAIATLAATLIPVASPSFAETDWRVDEIVDGGVTIGCIGRAKRSSRNSAYLFFDRSAFAIVFKSDDLPKTKAFIQDTLVNIDHYILNPDRIQIWDRGLVAVIWKAKRAPSRLINKSHELSLNMFSLSADHNITLRLAGMSGILEKLSECQAHPGASHNLLSGDYRPILAAFTDGGRATAKETDDTLSLEEEDHERLIRRVQIHLARIGCYSGKTDGKWGRRSQAALSRYGRLAGLTGISEPDKDTLAYLRGEDFRICPLECDTGLVVKGGRCVTPKKKVRKGRKKIAKKPDLKPKAQPRRQPRRVIKRRKPKSTRHEGGGGGEGGGGS